MKLLLWFLITCVFVINANAFRRKSCGENEIFQACASMCLDEPTCQDAFPTSAELCERMCLDRCECNRSKGYIRDSVTKRCVRSSDCSMPELCSPREHMGCAPYCPKSVYTCQNRNPPPCNTPGSFDCIPKCVCDAEFLRDEKSGKCVPPGLCPAN